MPDKLRVDEEGGFIEVQSYGVVSKEDIAKSLAEVRHIFETKGIDNVLVDTTQQTSLPSTIDIYDLASTFPRELKIAFLMQESQATMQDLDFVQAVASNRAANVRSFYERERALEWFDS